MTTLRDLYSDQYTAKRPDTAEFRALQEADLRNWEQVEAAMGKRFVERCLNQRLALEADLRYNDFREGFLLGASLLLELLWEAGKEHSTPF